MRALPAPRRARQLLQLQSQLSGMAVEVDEDVIIAHLSTYQGDCVPHCSCCHAPFLQPWSRSGPHLLRDAGRACHPERRYSQATEHRFNRQDLTRRLPRPGSRSSISAETAAACHAGNLVHRHRLVLQQPEGDGGCGALLSAELTPATVCIDDIIAAAAPGWGGMCSLVSAPPALLRRTPPPPCLPGRDAGVDGNSTSSRLRDTGCVCSWPRHAHDVV